MRSRLGLMAVAAGVAAGVTVTGLRLLRDNDAEPRVAVPVPAAVDVTGDDAAAGVDGPGGSFETPSGPTGETAGLPVGYVRSEHGAQAAAVGWVGSLGPLMRLGPIALDDALRAVLSERIAQDTIDTFRQERDRFVTEFGADPVRGVWSESPLSVDLVEFRPGRAVVAVWSLLLMGVADEDVVASWRTQTVTLVWEAGDWRVDDVVRREGPTPLVSPGELPAAGADLAAVAGWVPAVLAGVSVDGGES